jgi:hypothetical protein
MSIPYEVIEQKEVLHEAFANLVAKSSRIVTSETVKADSQAHHILSVLHKQLVEEWNSIIGPKYTTLEDMEQEKGKYVAFSKMLDSIEDIYDGK